MTETTEQIKYMVNRFLGWRLPKNFNPDGGISFTKTFNESTPWPMKYEPTGTNLLDAAQAEEMVRYMVEGIPSEPSPAISEAQAVPIPEDLRDIYDQAKQFAPSYFTNEDGYGNGRTRESVAGMIVRIIERIARAEATIADLVKENKQLEKILYANRARSGQGNG